MLRRSEAGYVDVVPAVTFGADGSIRTHEAAEQLATRLGRG